MLEEVWAWWSHAELKSAILEWETAMEDILSTAVPIKRELPVVATCKRSGLFRTTLAEPICRDSRPTKCDPRRSVVLLLVTHSLL